MFPESQAGTRRVTFRRPRCRSGPPRPLLPRRHQKRPQRRPPRGQHSARRLQRRDHRTTASRRRHHQFRLPGPRCARRGCRPRSLAEPQNPSPRQRRQPQPRGSQGSPQTRTPAAPSPTRPRTPSGTTTEPPGRATSPTANLHATPQPSATPRCRTHRREATAASGGTSPPRSPPNHPDTTRCRRVTVVSRHSAFAVISRTAAPTSRRTKKISPYRRYPPLTDGSAAIRPGSLKPARPDQRHPCSRRHPPDRDTSPPHPHRAPPTPRLNPASAAPYSRT